MIEAIAAAAALLIWVYLLTARGRFWRTRADERTAGAPPNRRICAVIPARNEAATISRAVSSLHAQLHIRLQIFVVDDESSDATAALAGEAGATVVRAAPLPEGWTGKMWAVSEGVANARSANPDYYLFTDADIEHAPGNVAALLARAEAENLDLASYMVRLNCESLAERLLIPAFVFFFLKLYPPAWIRDPQSSTAGAAGGCILVRASALERIGGIEAIRDRLIDDCALARAVKQSGGRIWMGLTTTTCSLRRYRGFGEIRDMIARTAFTQLEHSAWLLAGAVVGLALTYAAPLALAVWGHGRAFQMGLGAWLLMCIAYAPILRLYGRSPLWGIALPLVASFYGAATLESAIRYWFGAGGLWKGRVQDRRI